MTTSDTIGSTQDLSIVLPAGWRRIHANRLLDDMLASVASRSESPGADGGEMQAATRVLSLARYAHSEDHLVLAAVRPRSDVGGIEQLTLALPDMRRVDPSKATSGMDATVETSPEIVEEVNIDGLKAISHCSLPDATGSRVQLVFVVPNSDRGAVLTLVSSVDGDEGRLKREATEIVGSIHMARVDEAEDHVAS